MEKNELIWLETEYIRNDITVQPVLVNGDLWYTVFDNHGYNLLFDTLLGLYEYLKDGKHEKGNCFETEDEMIKYLEQDDDYLDDDYLDVPDRYPDEIYLEAQSNRAETEYFNR